MMEYHRAKEEAYRLFCQGVFVWPEYRRIVKSLYRHHFLLQTRTVVYMPARTAT